MDIIPFLHLLASQIPMDGYLQRRSNGMGSYSQLWRGGGCASSRPEGLLRLYGGRAGAGQQRLTAAALAGLTRSLLLL